MNVRQRKRMLYLAAGLCGAGVAAVVTWGLITPVEVTAARPSFQLSSAGQSTQPSDRASARHTPARPSLEQLQRLASMKLRQPLYDPEPTQAQKQAKQTQPSHSHQPDAQLTLRLVGTVQEPGHSMAMFQTQDGTIELCAQGHSVENGGDQAVVKVTRVEHRKVVVQYNGQSHELSLPEKKASQRP
jgi:hypothetical protein